MYIPETARVFTLMNDVVDPKSADFKHLLTLTNLSPDTLETVDIHLPPSWQDMQGLQILRVTGKWETIDYSLADHGITISEPLSYLEPMYLKFL